MGFFTGLFDVFGKDDEPTTTVQNNYDPEYTKKMADIAERQQKMAEEQWDMYKGYFQEYEIEVARANSELLPYMSDATRNELQYQSEASKANAELMPEYYKAATEGVDVQRRMDEAGNEVRAQTKLGQESMRREMGRYGIDPGSSTFATAQNTAALETAKGVAGARTAAKTQAEQENFQRMGQALGKASGSVQVVNNADPAARATGQYSGAAQSYAPLATRVLSSTKTGPQTSFYDFAGQVLGTGLGSFAGGYGGALGARTGL